MKPPGVDLHAHVFNVTDLPSVAFVRDVVVNLDESGVVAGVLLRPLVGMVTRLLGLGAPGGRRELRRLQGRRELTRIAGFREAGETLGPLTESEVFEAQLEAELARLCQGDEDEKALFEQFVEAYGIEDRAVFETLPLEEGGAAVNPESAAEHAPEGALRRGTPRARTQRLLSREQWVRGPRTRLGALMDFVGRLRDFRYANCERLIDLYGKAGGVQLFVPALIDYNHWLGRNFLADDSIDTPTNLEEQVEVMDAVHQAMEGVVHSYMAYDPLRDLREGGRSLRLVKRAVTEHGFIGVKVYPPMGFQGFGNEGLDFFDPNHPAELLEESATLGRGIDRRLIELYQWCIAEEVPILAHSGPTVLSNTAYGDRPNPAHWNGILDRDGFRELRVNMGHFAGFSDDVHDNRSPLWAGTVIDQMKAFPHIYADLSFHDEILDEEFRGKYAAALREIIDHDATGNVVKRLAYGSDWVMLAKVRDHGLYYRTVHDLLKDEVRLNEEQLSDVLGGNALRFLGLVPESRNRQRLEAYYQSRGMEPPAWFLATAT